MWIWTQLKLFLQNIISSTLVILCKNWRKQPSQPYPANTVILHQIGRAPYAPSLSPFPLKLETYLRMAEIPYQNVHGHEMSSKGKTPWITYNGVEVADSQFCIEYLNKELSIDLNNDLSPVERSTARAFQTMTEEHLYWCAALWRWAYDPDWTFLKMAIPVPLVSVILKKVSCTIKKQAYGQGLGRHTQAEVMAIGQADMKALSDFLGKKKFFMGDRPTEVDCAIFGMIALIGYLLLGSPLEKYLKDDLPNLTEYCETMKQSFWPDWDECNTRGGTCEAKK